MLVAGKISFLRAALYIVVQCCGAIAGTAAVLALLPHNLADFGDTKISAEITPVQGLGIEFFFGFILVFCVFGVCDENKPGKSPCLRITMVRFVICILFIRFEIYCATSNWSDRDVGASGRYPVHWCEHESS